MGDGSEISNFEWGLNENDEVLKILEEFRGDDSKLSAASANADFGGLVPEDFYDGISERSLADIEVPSEGGPLSHQAERLEYLIKKLKEFYKAVDENNLDANLDLSNPDSLIASGGILGAISSIIALRLDEFKAALEEFFHLNGLLPGDMETGETDGNKKGNTGGSYSGGSSSFDPSLYDGEYDFGDDDEDGAIGGGFDDGEVDDDFEFEEETEPEEPKEEEEEKEEGAEETEEEPQEIVPTEPEKDPNTIDGNKIIDEVKDANGNTVAVSVISDGKKKWYQVVNGNVIVPKEAITTFKLPQDVTVTINGEQKTINSGNYPVDQVIYNADGSIRSVRMICDDIKVWAHLDSNGNIIKCDYITGQNGYAELTGASYDKIDMYGNNVGKFSTGPQSINEVMYDSNGNIIAYKLTGNGVYEEWLYPNGDTTNGTFSLYDQIQASETSSVATFNDNKGLYGLLGVLFVALGATLVVRKKIKAKENAEFDDSEEYTDGTYVEDSLPAGNYGIYDVKKNDEGTITEARISPDNSSDEYWVEV